MAQNAHMTEEALVAGCQRNDRLSQERFYRKFFPAMYRMCRRYTNQEEEILEILNNGFLKVFTKIGTYEFKGSLEGWVRRIMFHSLADYYRKHDRKIKFLPVEDWDKPSHATVLEGLYFEDLISIVDRLPTATREVFWRYAVEGYNHAEIGEQLGISVGTSKWHLSNARKKMKELL
ncbi:MAG: RNA polymerase sigma factor, partial [Bacteroidetes bacterium]